MDSFDIGRKVFSSESNERNSSTELTSNDLEPRTETRTKPIEAFSIPFEETPKDELDSTDPILGEFGLTRRKPGSANPSMKHPHDST